FGDGPRFALLLDRHLDALRHLDGVDFRSAFVERPEVSVDAAWVPKALVALFGRAPCLLRLTVHRIRRGRTRSLHGWCYGPRQRTRVWQSGIDDRHISEGDTVLAHSGCLRSVDGLRVSHCPADLGRCSGILDAE